MCVCVGWIILFTCVFKGSDSPKKASQSKARLWLRVLTGVKQVSDNSCAAE